MPARATLVVPIHVVSVVWWQRATGCPCLTGAGARGGQPAQSVHTGSPVASSTYASWLRWWTRKHSEQVNSSSS